MCPFVRSGECDVPPCRSCYVWDCPAQERMEGGSHGRANEPVPGRKACEETEGA